jgi:DNA polymerase-3 subunit epsilon
VIALIFDTETTGFKSSTFTPEIVQIGALVQDTDTKRVLAELNVIVTAKNPIPPRVSEIHGITDELNALYGIDSRGAESMFGLLAQMSDTIVAHNIVFDMGIIKDAWPVAYGILSSKVGFCTMVESESIVGLAGSHAGGTKYPKLIEAYRHFYGKDFDNAHDAMADVRACRDVYFALLEANK